MELWDLYTEDRKLIGIDHVRGELMPAHTYHLVVHVWIRNSDGKYLISQRAANRLQYPLQYECTGGSVVKGENSIDGAIREVKEEVGIELSPNCGHILFTKVRHQFNDILDVWLFAYDGAVNLSQATTYEVAKVCWMTREEIQKLFDDKQFVETLHYFFDEVDGK